MAPPDDPRDTSTARPEFDRRAPRGRPGLAGLLKRLRGLLARPVRVERRGLQLHLEVVERRRARGPFRPASELRLIDELESCLVAIDGEPAALAMRQLVRVHEALRRKGWSAVETMSARDLGRAALQCELLGGVADSAALPVIAERLRLMQVGATQREERLRQLQRAASEGGTVVAEVSFEDYCEQERRQGVLAADPGHETHPA